MSGSKIITFEEFNTSHSNIMLIGGCFDILHQEHINFITLAKNYKPKTHLITLLESDEFIITKKLRYPQNSQENRAKNLQNTGLIDDIIMLSEVCSHEKYCQMLDKIRPKYIGITHPDEKYSNKQLIARQINAEVATLNHVNPAISTTLLIQKMAQNPQFFRGEIQGIVTCGRGQARQLGAPTFNMKLPEISIPTGVYLCNAKLNGRSWKAICYFDAENRPEVLEVHILGEVFQNSPQEISVNLLEFMRGKIAFSSPEDLKRQISHDLLLAQAKSF